jgi:hypothetical protein
LELDGADHIWFTEDADEVVDVALGTTDVA